VGAADHEAGDVGDVGHEVGADFLRDLADELEVEKPRVGGGPRDDDLGPLPPGHLAHLVVVDEVSDGVDRVLDGAPEAGRGAYLPAVSEVAAVRQGEAHDRVPGLEEGVIDGEVRRRARVGLHVGVVHVEQGLGPLDDQVFQLVGVALALVVALPRIAFRVLVHEDRAQGFHDGGGGVVFGRDEADGIGLVLLFLADEGIYLGVCLLQVFEAHRGLLAAVQRSAQRVGDLYEQKCPATEVVGHG